MLAIATKYIGATNYRGSRVKANVMEKHRDEPVRSIVLDWDHGLDSQGNHQAAAKALIVKIGWTSENGYGPWIMGASEPGYVFVCDTRHGGDRMVV